MDVSVTTAIGCFHLRTGKQWRNARVTHVRTPGLLYVRTRGLRTYVRTHRLHMSERTGEGKDKQKMAGKARGMNRKLVV